MPDDKGNNQAGGQDAPEGNNQQDDLQFDVSGLPPAAQLHIKGLEQQIAALNQESAGRRVALNDLQEKMAALQKAQKDQLEQDGNFKSLYEQAQAEIATLQPHKDRSEQLEATIRASNEADIERIPDEMKPLVPTKLSAVELRAWLDGNLALLMKQPAPSTDAGAGSGTGSTPVEITAADRAGAEYAQAQGYQVTAEAIAKRRAAKNN